MRPRSPGHNTTARILLREADTALYAAKQAGRGRGRLFDERLQQKADIRVRLESELRQGIDLHQFVVHYQPIRSVTDQHVLGVEALLRWRHPRRGLLLPGEFIAAAEHTGLIVPLGRWVLQTACAEAARWQHQQARPLDQSISVSVNVSPRQLDDPDLPRHVAAAMHVSGLAEGSLALELTETALLDEEPAGLASLTRLRQAGANLVLDDFGTGYSSLTHLTRLPISALKVDQSFVAGLGRNKRDAAVVSAVVALGSELGMRVIARGGRDPRAAVPAERNRMLRRAGISLRPTIGHTVNRPVTASLAAGRHVQARSRTTCLAALSCLRPSNRGCRNLPSRVHSEKPICATSSGRAQ